ncbi:uncharacterized protein EHS24_003468 [Apiotrichum porosum]|uniref:Uncharacterized protein n=1 Tax=Apiotrichum porosum TaxID=105984 RepID=A0A427XF02_9TREE|nr:uncharacterized protein EHS24_003468 [Apiotrichum porosum]RSH77491.1 hypothetical protein EHS24_003468 [Apiotrichum porosum]
MLRPTKARGIDIPPLAVGQVGIATIVLEIFMTDWKFANANEIFRKRFLALMDLHWSDLPSAGA